MRVSKMCLMVGLMAIMSTACNRPTLQGWEAKASQASVDQLSKKVDEITANTKHTDQVVSGKVDHKLTWITNKLETCLGDCKPKAVTVHRAVVKKTAPKAPARTVRRISSAPARPQVAAVQARTLPIPPPQAPPAPWVEPPTPMTRTAYWPSGARSGFQIRLDQEARERTRVEERAPTPCPSLCGGPAPQAAPVVQKKKKDCGGDRCR